MALALNPALFPDLVYLMPQAETPDVDGGTMESFTPDPAGAIPCAVAGKLKSLVTFAGDQELGMTPVVIAFPEKPAIAKGDRLYWQGRTIRAIAPPHPRSGFASLHVLEGEIRD